MNGALNCRMPQLPRCEFVQSRQRIGIPAHHLRDETLFLSPRWGWPHFRLAPMACAMGCMLTPLRGLKTALCVLKKLRLRLRTHRVRCSDFFRPPVRDVCNTQHAQPSEFG